MAFTPAAAPADVSAAVAVAVSVAELLFIMAASIRQPVCVIAYDDPCKPELNLTAPQPRALQAPKPSILTAVSERACPKES